MLYRMLTLTVMLILYRLVGWIKSIFVNGFLLVVAASTPERKKLRFLSKFGSESVPIFRVKRNNEWNHHI